MATHSKQQITIKVMEQLELSKTRNSNSIHLKASIQNTKSSFKSWRHHETLSVTNLSEEGQA